MVHTDGVPSSNSWARLIRQNIVTGIIFRRIKFHISIISVLNISGVLIRTLINRYGFWFNLTIKFKKSHCNYLNVIIFTVDV